MTKTLNDTSNKENSDERVMIFCKYFMYVLLSYSSNNT